MSSVPGRLFHVVTPDGELEAARWGLARDDTPTLVLLHEGLGSVGLWRAFPGQLAERTGLPVLAYTRAGYGRSAPCALPRPRNFMAREAREILPAVLAATGVGRHVLVGHSDGATIAALRGGGRAPGLEGLVLIAPHFFVEDISIRSIEAAREAFETGDLRERLARHHDHPEIAFRGWNDVWLDPGFRSWDVTGVIDSWQVPCLAIQGTDDPYGTRAQVDVIAERRTDAEVALLDGLAHAPHLEAPYKCLDRIAGFVRRLQS